MTQYAETSKKYSMENNDAIHQKIQEWSVGGPNGADPADSTTDATSYTDSASNPNTISAITDPTTEANSTTAEARWMWLWSKVKN
jgi:hypothetical protein